ncbi:MAG: alkaline phosphatase family protein [Candidatus Thorarchaeota archaeon]
MRGNLIKNIIIGIDGGTFNHIIPLLRKNLLPNFETLIKKGFYSYLKVTVPPVTIPSFPCIFSGLTVEDLGYCTFVIPSKGIFSSDLWKQKSVLSINNLKVFSLNLPSSYPAWEINGEMITGLMSPHLNSKICFPQSLIKTIPNNWIIDGINIDQTFQAFNMKKEYFYEQLKRDFDLLIYVIRIPDCASHHPKIRLKNTTKAIEKGYIEIDKFFGDILNKIDFDNLFVISDHGLKLYQYEFNIKRFLERKGLIFQNKDRVSKILSILIKISGYFNYKFLNTTYMHNKFKDLIKKIKIFKSNHETESNSTKFIHFYSNYGGIFLSKDDKGKRDRIRRVLLNSKYVKEVLIYNSPSLPDLIVILKDKYLYSVKSSIFIQNRFNSINHSEKGIFIAFGKNIRNEFMKETNYIDFAPTLLNLYNLKKLDHMRGNSLKILKDIDLI